MAVCATAKVEKKPIMPVSFFHGFNPTMVSRAPSWKPRYGMIPPRETPRPALDVSDIPVETHPKAPPGTRRPRKPPRVVLSPPPSTPQCTGGCKEYSRRGTNATVERFTCVDCGFVTTRSKGATEDPAMCPHVETDTRGSSKTLAKRV